MNWRAVVFLMSDIDYKERLKDALNISYSRNVPRFLGFLSESETAEILPMLSNIKHRFFGGYESSQRNVLAILPDWCDGEDEIFPISSIKFEYRKQDKLAHKDFLGSVMALGIKRATVGDILIGEGIAVMFVFEEIADYILSQITKVGSVGVKLSKEKPEILPGHSDFLYGSCTISSLRLDCVVAALGKYSRNGANEKIQNSLVTLNSAICEKSTVNIKNGDILSIRTCGKFVIESVEHRSKKGRVILKWKKYM